MSQSGMARKVDDLGRIVLPVEMRRLFGIQAGDALEIGVEDGGIMLRTVQTRCVFCGGTESLRSYREKRLCSSCATGLGVPVAPPCPELQEAPVAGVVETALAPAEPQGDVVDTPPWQS